MFFAFNPDDRDWIKISAADYLFHLRDAAEFPNAYEGWNFLALK